MKNKSRIMKALAGERSGNIAISSALVAPLIIGALALGVDFGTLSLQERRMQTIADLAAISAASSPETAEKGLLHFFQDNDLNYALVSDDGFLLSDSQRVSRETALEQSDCLVVFETGNYTADPGLEVKDRFVVANDDPDAVRVTSTCAGRLYFAHMLGTAPTLEVKATAATRKTASFWIGSRLASLNEGILNSVLGATLGTSLSLKALDYRALMGAELELLSFIPQLSTEAGIEAVTYQDVLDADIRMATLFASLRKSGQFSASLSSVLGGIEQSLSGTSRTFRLSQILDIEDAARYPLGSPLAPSTRMRLMDMVSLSALASGGSNQILSAVALEVPGIASAKVDIAVGEPAVHTPPVAVGSPGARIRTAQVRIGIRAELDGLLSLFGARVSVPLYLEIANAEARLGKITCSPYSGNASSVEVDAVPGILNVAIGNVDPNAFINFGGAPRVSDAYFVEIPGLRISGRAEVNSGNMTPTRLRFDANAIREARDQTVSTRTPLTSLVNSAFERVEPRIELLGIQTGLPGRTHTASLHATLEPLTSNLDGMLYNVLLALGVGVGEADIAVTGARCDAAVLVI
ncbi:pilus assembly protein TadG-related protein [Hoeflea sp.]|uniref:pilus assembly protein TadG-related protein n=1 Tax=Hoeflea sp. TaxID=1940281 RepID=UPI003BAFC941